MLNKFCRFALFFIFSLVLFSSIGWAQLMKGPTLSADNRVTFQIHAPDASYVKVINLSDSAALGAPEYQMTKNSGGDWSVTTESCRPGLHYYEFDINGARVSDPAAPLYFGWGKWTSCLEVPDANLDFYLPKDVPHGEVRLFWYVAKTTQTFRKCLVYTPPNYDADTTVRYPVLYLQHGAGESELGWTMQGKANFILDNLIAEDKARPMIIVMDNGYAARPGAENPQRPRGDDNLFSDLVTKDLIPMIDNQFRTIADREHRAIAGLSMGAGQALRIGLGHPELFASVAGFSGGIRRANIESSFDGIFRDAEKFNSTFKLFFFGYGTLERGFESMQAFSDELRAHGINHVWSEPVGSHEWQVWRVHLYECAQHLFQ